MEKLINQILDGYTSVKYREIDLVKIKSNGREKNIWLIKLTINESEYLMDILIKGDLKKNIETFNVDIQWNIKYI